jgi:hypothetical protein
MTTAVADDDVDDAALLFDNPLGGDDDMLLFGGAGSGAAPRRAIPLDDNDGVDAAGDVDDFGAPDMSEGRLARDKRAAERARRESGGDDIEALRREATPLGGGGGARPSLGASAGGGATGSEASSAPSRSVSFRDGPARGDRSVTGSLVSDADDSVRRGSRRGAGRGADDVDPATAAALAARRATRAARARSSLGAALGGVDADDALSLHDDAASLVDPYGIGGFGDGFSGAARTEDDEMGGGDGGVSGGFGAGGGSLSDGAAAGGDGAAADAEDADEAAAATSTAGTEDLVAPPKRAAVVKAKALAEETAAASGAAPRGGKTSAVAAAAAALTGGARAKSVPVGGRRKDPSRKLRPLDDVTVLSGKTLKSWIDDPSGTMRAPLAGHLHAASVFESDEAWREKCAADEAAKVARGEWVPPGAAVAREMESTFARLRLSPAAWVAVAGPGGAQGAADRRAAAVASELAPWKAACADAAEARATGAMLDDPPRPPLPVAAAHEMLDKMGSWEWLALSARRRGLVGAAGGGVGPYHDVTPDGRALGARPLGLDAEKEARESLATLGGIQLSPQLRDFLWSHVTLTAEYPSVDDGGAPSPLPPAPKTTAEKRKAAAADKRAAAEAEEGGGDAAADVSADAAADAAAGVAAGGDAASGVGGGGGAGAEGGAEWREMSDAPSTPARFSPWGEAASPASAAASARGSAAAKEKAASTASGGASSGPSPLETAATRASAAESRGGARAAAAPRITDDDADVETDDALASEPGVVAAKKWHAKTVSTLVALSTLMTGPLGASAGGARKRRAADAGDGLATPANGGDLADVSKGVGTAGAPLSFAQVTKGATRRFAAQTFRELLILKSWDVVDVKQREPYGDIAIARTVRGRATRRVALCRAPALLIFSPRPRPLFIRNASRACSRSTASERARLS